MNAIDTEKIQFDESIVRIAYTNPDDFILRASQILKTRRAYAIELRRKTLTDENRDYLEKCIMWCNSEIKKVLNIL